MSQQTADRLDQAVKEMFREKWDRRVRAFLPELEALCNKHQIFFVPGDTHGFPGSVMCFPVLTPGKIVLFEDGTHEVRWLQDKPFSSKGWEEGEA